MTTAQLLKEMARIEKDAQEDHARLRGDFTAFDLRMTAHLVDSAKDRTALTELTGTIAELGRRKTDFDSLRFPPKVIVGVVTTVIAIVVYFGSALYGVQSRITTLVDQMAANEQIAKAREEVNSARSDAKVALDSSLRTDVTDMKRQIQLMQIQLQSLDKTVSSKTR